MAPLPIQRMILYKHGVGYFERRGPVEGTTLRLSFAREAMDDVLKSLVALDLGAGQVLGIDFDTPEDREVLLARGSIHLSDNRSLLDLLRDLRGRQVRFFLEEQQAPREQSGFGLRGNPLPPDAHPPAPMPLTRSTIEGLVVGVDIEGNEELRRPLVTLYLPDERQVRMFFVHEVKRIELLEDAAADLSYFLRAAQSEEDRRSATVQLTDGSHDMLIGYIAPAPAWRVSYRMLVETEDGGPETEDEIPSEKSDSSLVSSPPSSVLLQGWGLFDNQLEEDLTGVQLSLVAGMPVSFRYRLYEPQTPERPLVEDEERTVSAPIFFEGAPPAAPAAAPMAAMRAMGKAHLSASAPSPEMPPAPLAGFAMADAAESVQAAASGEERGALFAYHVSHPVSVARGQSAMVPILSQRIACRRDLIYNGQKQPKHPVASLRLTNETGLTLERGPVTVLEEGDYAGEAVVPFTRAGGELIVPFAVELGVRVEESQEGERHTVGMSIRNSYLIVQEYDIQRRTYQLTSTLNEPATVLIEHSLLEQYELHDVREPDERTASVARWEVACAPHTRTVFRVSERRITSRREQVRGQTVGRLRAYLRDRLLDEATVRELERVLSLYAQIDEAQRRLGMIEQERQQIYNQQRQIQGSLAPLGKEGDEGALRQRYVALLNTAEDQLVALAREETELKARITQLEQQAAAELETLGRTE